MVSIIVRVAPIETGRNAVVTFRRATAELAPRNPFRSARVCFPGRDYQYVPGRGWALFRRPRRLP